MKQMILFYTDAAANKVTAHSVVNVTQETKDGFEFVSQEYLEVKLGQTYYCKRALRKGSLELWSISFPQIEDKQSPYTYCATFEEKSMDIDEDWLAGKRVR